MSSLDQLLLCGAGHWSCHRDLQYPLWSWCIEREGMTNDERQEVWKHSVTNQVGVVFIVALMPFLPTDFRKYIEFPDCIPGGSSGFTMPLSAVNNFVSVEEIIKKFLPMAWNLCTKTA